MLGNLTFGLPTLVRLNSKHNECVSFLVGDAPVIGRECIKHSNASFRSSTSRKTPQSSLIRPSRVVNHAAVVVTSHYRTSTLGSSFGKGFLYSSGRIGSSEAYFASQQTMGASSMSITMRPSFLSYKTLVLASYTFRRATEVGSVATVETQMVSDE